MFEHGEKLSISSRMYPSPDEGNEYIKESTRLRFGIDLYRKISSQDTPVVVYIKESEIGLEGRRFSADEHCQEVEFRIEASCTAVEYKTVIVEVPRHKYVHVKAPFWRRIKWMVTGE